MRRFATPLLLLLALWGGLAHADSLSKGSVVDVPLHQLKPSQMMVGRAEVDASFRHWERKAADSGLTLEQYAKKHLVPKFGHMKLEAIVDPQGNVRPTDGHHRISALLEVAKQTGVAVPVQVKIAKDYRGRSMEKYANDFVIKREKGAFTRGVGKLDPVERVQHLPDSFASLKNSPMRSAMAHVFVKLGIGDSKLVDYAEFRAGDWLADHGVFHALEEAGLVKPHTTTLPKSLTHDPRALDVMARAFDNPDGQRFLLSLARHDEDKLEKRLTTARR